MLETGDILVGRYELGRLLGRGGMSTVFAGFDRTLARDVAIKVLAPALAEDSLFVERFEREARAAASLSQRNVVAVFDTGVEEGARFIVMERVFGETLAQALTGGPLAIGRAVEIGAAVARALAAAHVRGIVHRDVKPANVMVGEGGQVKVLDFGIARAVAASPLTGTHLVIGTAGYLSPEQAEGAPADARSDIYGLGCVLYEMLTGRPPFIADSAASLVHQQLNRLPEPPSRRRPELSGTLDRIVMRCLAKDPGDRYQRADALAAALLESPMPAEERTPVAAAMPRRSPRPLAAAPASPRLGASRSNAPLAGRERRRLFAAPVAAVLLLALLVALALAQGSGGTGHGPRARTASTASATARPVSATSAATVGPARAAQSVAGAPRSPPGQTRDLSALILADERVGLIDPRYAPVLSQRLASLGAAISQGDGGATANDLAEFIGTVDSLSADGAIGASAAGALRAAAGGLVGATGSAQTPDESGTPPPAATETGGEGGRSEGHDGAARRHDGGGGSQD